MQCCSIRYGLKAANTDDTLKSKKWPDSATYKYETSGDNAYKWQNSTGQATYFKFDGTPAD